jgi:hypothetical protein
MRPQVSCPLLIKVSVSVIFAHELNCLYAATAHIYYLSLIRDQMEMRLAMAEAKIAQLES